MLEMGLDSQTESHSAELWLEPVSEVDLRSQTEMSEL